MILGKITIRVEYKEGRPKWFYCRPVSIGNNIQFPTRIGVCHVVYINKCTLTEHFQKNEVYTVYGIFDKIPTREQIESGFIDSKVLVITEEIYNMLLENYPQEHDFIP